MRVGRVEGVMLLVRVMREGGLYIHHWTLFPLHITHVISYCLLSMTYYIKIYHILLLGKYVVLWHYSVVPRRPKPSRWSSWSGRIPCLAIAAQQYHQNMLSIWA